MKKKRPFQVYLDHHDARLLDRLADQLGLSRADAVRQAVRRWALELTGQEDPLLGLVGSMDDPALPTDLSTRHDEYAVEGYRTRRVAEPTAERKDDE